MIKNTIVFTFLLMLITGLVQAGDKYSVVSFASTKKNSIKTLDARFYQRAGQVSVYYSFGFIGGRELLPYVPGLMLGAGIQLPRKQSSPYFFGMAGYLILDKKACDSGSIDQRRDCVKQENRFIEGTGSRYLIQPEIGLRMKIYNNIRMVGSVRYWFSNDETLGDSVSFSMGVQF